VLRPASDRERNDLDFYQPVGIMPVLTPRSPRPPRALNQIEIFLSIIQKKVISPNDFASPGELSATLLAFVDRYNQAARPFNWNYTATDLARYLGRINGQQQPASMPEAA
jgi:hypothetical protein